uniref:Uncharacterized protein n=1 Tax=Caenorhabditis japonica TaxID=281687 RepID=A0A8R1ILK4_CAEJA
MRILNENLRSQKKRITRFAKKATECFENGKGTLINILAGIKDKNALAEDIVRQQAEKELQLDRENPALPDRTEHYRATLKAYTYEKDYPEWIKKLEYMNTQLKALIDIMVGVEAQAPSPRSDRFIEHFIHEEQEDLKERGNVASKRFKNS